MLDSVPLIHGPGINKPMEIIEKVWGKEYIYPTDSGYTAKIMEVYPGGRCSTHFHREKNETFILISGKLNVVFYSQHGSKTTKELKSFGEALILPNCTPHLFFVNNDTEESTYFIEASTEDKPEDSFRLDRSSKKVCLRDF